MKNSHGMQRRKHKRYAFVSQIKLYNRDREPLDSAKCTNLGQGGMRFTTQLSTLIEGSHILIELNGKEGEAPLTFLAEVRYRISEEEDSEMSFRQDCGVAFLEMNHEQVDHVKTLVDGCSEI